MVHNLTYFNYQLDTNSIILRVLRDLKVLKDLRVP